MSDRGLLLAFLITTRLQFPLDLPMDKQDNITYHGERLYGTKQDNREHLGVVLAPTLP